LNGHVVLFADIITDSIAALTHITDYRRTAQNAYNQQHNITPQSTRRAAQESLSLLRQSREANPVLNEATDLDVATVIAELQNEMAEAAARLEYERAAILRDQIKELQKQTADPSSPLAMPHREVNYRDASIKKKAAARKQARR
jgi:excinuclease ABC subunit B